MTEEVSPVVAAGAEEGEQANLEESFPLTGEDAPAEGADAEEGGHLPPSSRSFPGYGDLSRAI